MYDVNYYPNSTGCFCAVIYIEQLTYANLWNNYLRKHKSGDPGLMLVEHQITSSAITRERD